MTDGIRGFTSHRISEWRPQDVANAIRAMHPNGEFDAYAASFASAGVDGPMLLNDINRKMIQKHITGTGTGKGAIDSKHHDQLLEDINKIRTEGIAAIPIPILPVPLFHPPPPPQSGTGTGTGNGPVITTTTSAGAIGSNAVNVNAGAGSNIFFHAGSSSDLKAIDLKSVDRMAVSDIKRVLQTPLESVFCVREILDLIVQYAVQVCITLLVALALALAPAVSCCLWFEFTDTLLCWHFDRSMCSVFVCCCLKARIQTRTHPLISRVVISRTIFMPDAISFNSVCE